MTQLVIAETTNVGRINHVYDGTGWVCKGGLIEEQRTNTCLYSSDIANAYWSGTSTKTANFGISPDGTQNAARVTGGGYFQSGGISKTGTQTFSFWAKTISGSSEVINAYLDGGFTTPALTITGTWTRFSVTQTFGTTNTGTVGVYPLSANILFYGPQLEAGSFPTSYIPTTSASATRSADVMQITGSDFSSFWNISEGCFVVDADTPAFSTRPICSADDNTANESIILLTDSTDPKFSVTDGGVSQAAIDAGTVTANTMFRLAACYKANDFAATLSGNAAVTDSSGTLPTVDRLRIGSSQAGNYQCGHIARLRYWNTRLDNATLRALST